MDILHRFQVAGLRLQVRALLRLETCELKLETISLALNGVLPNFGL